MLFVVPVGGGASGEPMAASLKRYSLDGFPLVVTGLYCGTASANATSPSLNVMPP